MTKNYYMIYMHIYTGNTSLYSVTSEQLQCLNPSPSNRAPHRIIAVDRLTYVLPYTYSNSHITQWPLYGHSQLKRNHKPVVILWNVEFKSKEWDQLNNTPPALKSLRVGTYNGPITVITNRSANLLVYDLKTVLLIRNIEEDIHIRLPILSVG